MAEILPFKGIRYVEEKIGKLESVTAPPYDVISTPDRDRLYEKNDYNVIRLILGKELPGDDERNNKYSRAADFFQGWLTEGILREDEEPAVYVYEQEYLHEGKKKTRRGFLALLKLEDFHKGGIFPHEETLSRPKKDRLNLLRVCKVNFSPIFTLYSDPARTLDEVLGKEEPLMKVEDAKGEKHKVWVITSGEKIQRMKRLLSDKEIYLADGHHRYETALRFRDEMRQQSSHYTGKEPYNYLMTYFTNIDDEGLTILPAHRLISGGEYMDTSELKGRLSHLFEITPFGSGENHLQSLLLSLKEGNDAAEHFFGMYDGDNLYLLRLKDEDALHGLVRNDRSWTWKSLDVTILHQVILNGILAGGKQMDEENISYLTDAGEVFRAVKEGKHRLAFFVNPTKINQVRSIARAGERMPGKATHFYPKLLTGLVMRRI